MMGEEGESGYQKQRKKKRYLQSLVFVGCLDKASSGRELLSRVTRIRHKLKLGLWPDLVQVPSRSRRADDIITTLNNRRRDMTDLVDVLKDMSIGLEEALVEEVVAFDTSKS
jgi:hypothetical protein